MANVLGELFGDIASAIREKTGDAEKMKPADFPEKISSIETGVDVSGVTATAGDVLEGKTFVDAEGNAVEGTMPNNVSKNSYLDQYENVYKIAKGYHDGKGRVSVSSTSRTIIPTKDRQYALDPSHVTNGFLTNVTVEPIPDQYQDVSGVTATAEDVLEGTTFVDSEGVLKEGTIRNCGSPSIVLTTKTTGVEVPSGYYEKATVYIYPEEKTVTPTKEQQIIEPSENKVLSKVTVEPIDESMFDVSEVTAKAEDVLEGKVIVTSTGSKVYGALAVDNLNPGEVIVYKKKKVSGFALDSTFGAFSPGYVSPSEFTLEGGKSYRVIWDGEEWNCEAFAFEMSGMNIVAIGNASSLGLSGNNEPFLITYNVTANNTQFHSTEQDAEHTIGIYTEATSEILLQEKTVSENGVVEPDAGYDGLSKVIVEVLSGGGNVKVASGSFTGTAKSLTISHNLGKTPDMVIIYCKDDLTTTSFGMLYFAVGLTQQMLELTTFDRCQFGCAYGFSSWTGFNLAKDITATSGTFITNANATQFTASDYYTTASGKTYRWMAISGLT